MWPKRRDDEVIDRLLGDLEAPIMRLMWERPAATVRDIFNELNARGRTVAYTTVMTVMSRLATKGLLSRERVGKHHVYRATTTREGFLRQVATRRVQELVDEFGDLAIARFVAEIKHLTPEHRRQLELLADDEAS